MSTTPDGQESDDKPEPDDGGGSHLPEAERETQAEIETVSAEDGIFSGVYGHDGAKTVVGAALRSGDTHILLEGPPGSGKSAFLLALESNVPGVLYRDGDQITAAKLREVLKSDPPILLIDEIDALDNDAYDVLSTPMEHGRLVRDSARESYDVSVGTQVVAACNHREELPEHIANRFRVLEFEKYDEEEFLNICSKMLYAEVDWVESEEMGLKVAETVSEITGKTDPREARDTAQMANSFEEIEELARALHDPDAEIDAGPIYADEIARAEDEVGRMQLRETLAEELVRSEPTDTPEGAEPDPEEGQSRDENPGVEADKHRSSKARPGGGNVEEEVEGAVEEAVAEEIDK